MNSDGEENMFGFADPIQITPLSYSPNQQPSIDIITYQDIIAEDNELGYVPSTAEATEPVLFNTDISTPKPSEMYM